MPAGTFTLEMVKFSRPDGLQPSKTRGVALRCAAFSDVESESRSLRSRQSINKILSYDGWRWSNKVPIPLMFLLGDL